MSATTRLSVEIESKLFTMFQTFGIAYQNFPHKAVLTCEDQKDIELPAPHMKNLFLKDDKGKYWLVAALDDTRVDLKTVAKTLQVKSLRFGSPESLKEHLGVMPGAVTVFALINDEQKKVYPLLDEKIFQHEMAGFHPLHNEATTVIASKDLLLLIKSLGREYRVLTQKELSP